MDKKIAQIVSVIFHPLIVPIYFLVYMLYGDMPWAFLPADYKSAVITSVGFGVSLMPLITIAAMLMLKVVRDVEMKSQKDRLPAVGISCFSAWLTLYLTHSNMQLPTPMLKLIEGFAMCTLLAFVITFKWRISLHGICAGAMFVFICILGVLSHIDFGVQLMVIIGLASLVCWARLYLDAHTPEQVSVGFLVGAVAMLSTLLV